MAQTSRVNVGGAAPWLRRLPKDAASAASSCVRCSAQRRPAWTDPLSAPLRRTRVGAAPRDALAEQRKELAGDTPGDEIVRREAALPFADNAPSWEELAELVAARRVELTAPEEDLETGPPNALAMKRTFGREGPVRVKLYRDHAGWCPHCQKIWIQLEEKRVPYVLEKINLGVYGDKPESFLRISPNGQVPVVEVDGRVVTESAVIAEALEEEFPETPLLPQNEADKGRVQPLKDLLQKLSDAYIEFLKCDTYDEALARQFEDVVGEVNGELLASGGPYFFGEFFSLLDIWFVSFLERAVVSMTYFKGLRIRGTGKWAAIERWFEALESRPAYMATKSDFYTYIHCLPPAFQRKVAKEGKPFTTSIDGRDGKSWHLPLEPITSTSVEPYSPGEDPPLDRLRAAAKLVGNHENVVKLGLRAVGQPGDKPVLSPLADPTAVPGMEWEGAVDAAFRHVAHALLVGVEEKQTSDKRLIVGVEGGIGGMEPIYAAEYVRDRVGVPRDLPYPAARQLRAHLNWLIDTLVA